MVEGIDEPLGVGHQAEDPAGRVADARDRARRAVGVGRVVLRSAGRASSTYRRTTWPAASSAARADGSASEELPLAVGDGQLDRLGVGDERRAAGRRGQADPARLEAARVVVRQRRGAGVRAAGEQAGADQDLEPVADAQDQPAAVVEPAQRVAQDDAQPRGEDPPGSQVVAVGEAAGDGQDLEAVERPRRLEQPADVPGLDVGARPAARRPTVSSSQLVPGARRTIARGRVMATLESVCGRRWPSRIGRRRT